MRAGSPSTFHPDRKSLAWAGSTASELISTRSSLPALDGFLNSCHNNHVVFDHLEFHLLREINERTKRLMATLDSFISDVAAFQADVSAALARAQASIDALKSAAGTLTPEQQAALDAADAAVKSADATTQAFDVPPPAPSAPASPSASNP